LTVAPSFKIDVRRLDEFSAQDLYRLLKLGCDVFVVEQHCAYPELDGKDIDTLHLRLLEGSEPIACARFWCEDGVVHIGRVAVSPAHRGKGLGEAVMRAAITACEARFPGAPIDISAQSHLQRFYGTFGFVPVSDIYDEDGIAHIDMRRAHGA
jgi:ElaA protein